MSSEDEIRRLRYDLDTLIERTTLISRRLAELEGRESRPAVAVGTPRETPPPIVKAVEAEEAAAPGPQSDISFTPRPGPLSRLADRWVGAPLKGFFEQRIEGFRSRTHDLGWEVLLGTYMLPRLAVICIAIAVVFFLTLAIERWGATWMPQLRIGMGYAVSAALVFIAWRSEGKYPGFARVLYGGGFAVMYFVTFATYFVEFAKIFVTPAPALVLMALIVGLWAIAAQLRQSKVIALLVTLLAHFTIFLATLTLDKSGPVSLTGLLAISAGSAFFLLRNRWYYVASIGLLGAYLNVFGVLAQGEGATPYLDFSVSMGVLILFFLIFSLAELFAPENLRRKAVPGWFRNGFVTFNTTACFLLCTVVMSNYDFSRDYQDLFRFAFGMLLLLLGLAYLRIRSQDPLFNVYMVKSIAILTLALATRYGDERLTAFLAIEMIVLLYSARRSGLIVMRLLGFAVAVIAFHHSMSEALYTTFGGESGLDALRRGMLPYTAPGYSETAFCALLGIAAFLFGSQLYQRTDWALLSPKSLPFPKPVLEVFWDLDLIGDCPSQTVLHEKCLKGFLFPYVFAVAGAALFLAYSFPLLHETHRFAVMAGFVLTLTVVAVLFEAKPFGLAAIVLFVCGLLPMGAHFFLDQESIRFSVAIAGLVALYATALSSEKAYFGQRPGLAFHQQPALPYLLYGGSAWLSGLLLIKAFSGLNPVFAMIAAAVLCAGFFLLLHPGVFIVLSGGFVFWASILFVIELNDTAAPIPIRFRLALVLLTALSLSCDRYFNRLGKERTALTVYFCAGLILNAFLLLLCYIEPRITADWRMTVSALTCFAFLGYAFMFHSPMAAVVSITGMCYVSCRHSAASFQADSLQAGLVAAFTLAAIYWILSERCYSNIFLPRYEKRLSGAAHRIGFDPSHPATALFPIVFAALLLLIFAYRIPHLAPANPVFITIGWFSVAALLFVLSIPFRQRFYRYTGLVVIFLALARLFLIDMKEQDPLLRVAAFAVAGGGLLVISIGYYKWMVRIQPGIRDKGE